MRLARALRKPRTYEIRISGLTQSPAAHTPLGITSEQIDDGEQIDAGPWDGLKAGASTVTRVSIQDGSLPPVSRLPVATPEPLRGEGSDPPKAPLPRRLDA